MPPLDLQYFEERRAHGRKPFGAQLLVHAEEVDLDQRAAFKLSEHGRVCLCFSFARLASSSRRGRGRGRGRRSCGGGGGGIWNSGRGRC